MSVDIVQHPFLGEIIGKYISVDFSIFVEVNRQIILKDLDPHVVFFFD